MEPDKFFAYMQIDVVQFPGGLGGNDIIEKTFKGPIQQCLMLFIIVPINRSGRWVVNNPDNVWKI